MGKRALIREVNERIRGLNASFGVVDGKYAVICECETSDCVERFDVPAQLHAEVCNRENCFLVLPGHEHSVNDHVIDRSESYVLVVEPSLLPAA